MNEKVKSLRAIPEKKLGGGGEGKKTNDIFFLWVVGVDIFQVIQVIGV